MSESNLENKARTLDKFLIVRDITNAIVSNLNLDEILQKIVDDVATKMGYLGCVIFLVEDNEKKIYSKTLSDVPLAKIVTAIVPNRFSNLNVSLEKDKDNLIIKTFVEKRPYEGTSLKDFIVPAVNSTIAFTIQKITGIKRILSLPIIYQDKNIGAIMFVKKSKDSFDSDLDLLMSFTNEIGIAIQNAKLFDQVERQVRDLELRNKQLEIISMFTNKIMTTMEVNKIAQIALDGVPEILGYLGALYSIYDRPSNRLRLVAYTNSEHAKKGFELLDKKPNHYAINVDDPDLQDTVNIAALKSGRVFVTGDFNDLCKKIVPKIINDTIQRVLGIKTIVSVPVKSKNETVGVINFFIANKYPKELLPIEIETLNIISNQISTALDNAFLYEKTRRTLDTLQKVYQKDKDMLDILGHELRTPITVSRGNLEILMKKVEKGEIQMNDLNKEKLEIAMESIKKESGLINELLSATKIDSGQLIIFNDIINLRKILEMSCKVFKDEATRQGLELRFIPSDNEIPTTVGDQVRIGEVVDNLISNAIKYTKTGFVEASIESDSKNITVHVKDTGNGIPHEEMHNLFQKFYRLNNYKEDSVHNLVRPAGTGLGLYVAKGIVDAHGGKIWVKSDGLGKGSIFSFSIPIRKIGDQPDPETQEADMFIRMKLQQKSK